jgi:copper(I)-binding protein
MMLKKFMLLTMVIFFSFAAVALADSSTVKVTNAWARATPPSAKMGAAYLTIKNTGKEDDRLKSVTTEVAAAPQIHTMTMDSGIMQMRELTEGLAIPAGGEVALSPDGTHIMLTGLKKPLVEGQKFDLLLHFEKAGEVKVTADIKSIGYSGDKNESTQNHSAH